MDCPRPLVASWEGQLSSAPGIMAGRCSSRLTSEHGFRVAHRAGVVLGSGPGQGRGGAGPDQTHTLSQIVTKELNALFHSCVSCFLCL